MSDWQPIATAPKDGTVVRVKNSCMSGWVEARFGDYHPSYGGRVKQAWTTWRDPDPFMPVPRGALVIPDEWQPAETTP